MAELTTTPTQEQSEPAVLSQPLLVTLNLDWYRIAYIAIFIVAIISRFWDLGSRVVSHDESLHTQFAYQYYIGDGYQHTPLMHGPFLFHITAVAYWLFGDSDATARLPVAIFGIILVLVPYLLRHWIGRVGALAASFIFLISPYVLYYSRYIRHDVYVIAWAMIVFISTWYYIRERKNKYLWWFAAGNALMFSTKEVSFIYVAIFCSFLVLRLGSQLLGEVWFKHSMPRLRLPLMLLGLAVLLAGAGFAGQRIVTPDTAVTETEATDDAFAADPTEVIDTTTETAAGVETVLRWLVIAGIISLGAGLFLGADRLRPQLDRYPEFDLIVLYSTILLPLMAALFTALAGWNPNDYAYVACSVPGQESMSALSLALSRLTTAGCWSQFFSQGLVRSGLFLVPSLIVGILVGLWWDRRRWPVAAIIFHSIFAILYTSVFSNPSGWASGMVGSLGYWIEQQEVERGSQPLLYYFFVVPFYAFMPLLFSLLAMRTWARQQKLNKIAGYWLSAVLLALFTYSFGGWLYNRPIRIEGGTTTGLPGLLAAAGVLFIAILYWIFVYQRQLRDEYQLGRRWNGFFNVEALTGFIPAVVYWLLLTWVAYTVAGEKMPWLSIHFVVPMALLAGWYLNEKFGALSRQEIVSRQFLLQAALAVFLIIALFLALGPLLMGKIQFGNQGLTNLTAIGRFLGSLIIAGALFYFWWRFRSRSDRETRNRAWVLGIFALLSLLTVRSAYMATFPNADYTTEFLVYAHGAPATKSEVLHQVEMLSMRLYGDKSIDVAYDNDSSWPLTWYLRDYPNRSYYGEAPGRDLLDSPVVIAGSKNWDKVEPLLGEQYQSHTYTFLWWPMEKYRDISWDAIFGLQNGRVPEDPARRRGLGNPAVREALWNIFFHRDYEKYGEVFGDNYTAGKWPLRHDLRLYIRKDSLASIWDYGLSAVNAEVPVDPYAEGERTPLPALVIGSNPGAAEGELTSPRNMAVGPDGNIYVTDSGNHRLQVFDSQGQFLRGWGNFGPAPGQFNEPWGVAVDEQFVYVADTWNHRVQKFSHEGQLVATLGQSGTPSQGQDGGGLFFGPRDIILLPDGRLLISDTGNHRLQVLDRNGNYLAQIGKGDGQSGQGLGEFYEPVGLARTADGGFVVADTWNGRVQRFNASLLPVAEWRVNAWFSDSINNKPYIAVDSSGYVYVTDPEGYRVLVFDQTGNYVARFGRFGPESSSFGLPNGITIDSEDNIYIADAANHRVLQFSPLELGGVAPAAVDDQPPGEETLEDGEDGNMDDTEDELPGGEGGEDSDG